GRRVMQVRNPAAVHRGPPGAGLVRQLGCTDGCTGPRASMPLASVLKTASGQPDVGSNPTPSAPLSTLDIASTWANADPVGDDDVSAADRGCPSVSARRGTRG